MGSGAEGVGELALVDEGGFLALPHHQLGAVLDLLVAHRETPGQGIVGIIQPLDDLDELGLAPVH